MCDRRGDPCDTYCGGAGCGKCGGLSCNEGLVNLAGLALNFANDAEDTLKEKEADADDLLRGISIAKRESDAAYDSAQMVFNMTFSASNVTETYKIAITKLLDDINEYLGTSGAKPEGIKTLAEEVSILMKMLVFVTYYKFCIYLELC